MLTLWGWDVKKRLLAQWGTLLTVTIVTDRLRTQLGRGEESNLQRHKAPTAINPAGYEFLKVPSTKPARITPDPTWSLVTDHHYLAIITPGTTRIHPDYLAVTTTSILHMQCSHGCRSGQILFCKVL